MGELIGSARAAWTQDREVRPFRHGVLLLASGTAAGQLLNLAAAPATTRMFTPADFGAFGVFTSFFSLLLVVVCGRLELAIPLAKSRHEALAVAVLAALGSVFVAIAVGIGTSIWAGALATHVGVPAAAHYLPLLSLALVAGGLYQVGSYWATREREFGAVARAKLPQGAAQALTPIVCWALERGPVGLILGNILGQVIGGGTLLRRFWRDIRCDLGSLRLEDLIAALKESARFPLISSWSGLINAAGLYVPGLLLARYYGPGALGGFILSQRVIGMPLALFGQATGQVYVGEAAMMLRQRPCDLAHLYRRTSGRLLMWGVVPIAFFAVVAVPAFTLLFGSNWREAGRFTQVLGVMYLAQLCVVPISQTLTIVGRQGAQLVWDLSRLLILTSAVAIAGSVGASAVSAVAVYATAMTGCYGCLWVLGDRTASRASHIGPAGAAGVTCA